MTLPTQTEAFRVTLDLISDGEAYPRKRLFEKARTELGLTDDEISQRTGSGVPVYQSRIDWGLAYLYQAKLAERVSKGVYRITEAGRKVAAGDLRGSDFVKWLNEEIARVNPWKIGADSDKGKVEEATQESPTPSLSDVSPEEQLVKLVEAMNDALESELLQAVLDHDEDFFEKLVVDLLEKMGYGAGKVTQHSVDGGIDGIITTDELGFNPIMTQAKRYSGTKVGRPELQAFAGALGSCTRGVFITTSEFSQQARDWAKSYPHATLVLIDGKRLAQLMVKYDLGVSTERTYEVKRIDGDYFEE